MSLKKSILSVLLLFVVSNILTTAWYAITDEVNFVTFRRDEPNYLGLVVNHLVFVIGFVYLFPAYMNANNLRSNAIKYGVVIAGIMFIPTGLVVRSIWQVDFNQAFLMNTIAHLVIGGILGLILFSIYNYKRQEAA